MKKQELALKMGNETQIERYKKLINFIDRKFKEEIKIKDVEEISFYSYRNINRIFLALQHETIGKYIKRLRLEKAAEYLKYSKQPISDIAFELGFNDIAAFSKAFKNKFNCAPSVFRDSHIQIQEITRQLLADKEKLIPQEIHFELEEIPDLEVLYLEYRGSYENVKAIQETWRQLAAYAEKKQLLNEETIFLAEVLDDDEISESIHCRYNTAIVLEKPLKFKPEGHFQTKFIGRQKYAKFLHKGSHESCIDTYNKIYAHWMNVVKLEFEDKPTLEFFLNDESDTAPEDLLTEIYIPVK